MKANIKVSKNSSPKVIELSMESELVFLKLCRSERANAFNGEMLSALLKALSAISKIEKHRALILTGAGDHFSAGADLKWMKEARKMSRFQNVKESHDIASLFKRLAELSLPTFALVHGNVYGGGVGMTAACDFAMADKNTIFCLSEGRLGMVSAVMMPYLMDKMDGGFLKWAILTAKPFGAAEALKAGLIQRVVDKEAWGEALKEELSQLFQVAPEAQKEFKKLYTALKRGAKPPNLISILARHRLSAEALEGAQAFEERRAPVWNRSLIKIPKNL